VLHETGDEPALRRPAAYGNGFNAHRDHLEAVAYRLLGSRAEAEDAVQEAWGGAAPRPPPPPAACPAAPSPCEGGGPLLLG
jgi:DNA-directed RNA polymerase specialized sigma24 family protein